MAHYVLIAHGAWFCSDGQDRPNKPALYEIPAGLEIRIYNIQGTCIEIADGLAILNRLMRSGGNTNLVPGENDFEGVKVVYKVFRQGTNSPAISNYDIGGDCRHIAGLFQIPNTAPIVEFNQNFRSTLQNIIQDYQLVVDGEENVLHLICCQEFK